MPTTPQQNTTQALTVVESERALASSPSSDQPGSIMAVIARAAADPAVDVAKMERLYAMLEKEHSRVAEQQYNQAMARAQSKLPMIVRDARNPQTGSMYAKLESICIMAAPTIEAEGFSLQFSEGESANPSKIRVLCKVGHTGGHSETFHVDLSPDDTGAKGNASKTKIHGEGSTFTYGRRYLTTMIFNMTVIGADDDGTRGARPKPPGPNALAGASATAPARADVELKRKLVDLTRSIHFAKGYALDDVSKSKLLQYLLDECILGDEEGFEELHGQRLVEVVNKVQTKLQSK